MVVSHALQAGRVSAAAGAAVNHMPRRKPPDREAGAFASLGIRSATGKTIEKSYMSRDASRRLRLAKRASKQCIAAGGSLAQAAAAAQAFGTPCDSASSDGSGGDEEDDDDGDAQVLVDAVSGQMNVADGASSSTIATSTEEAHEPQPATLPGGSARGDDTVELT